MTQTIDAALLSDARILAAYLIFFGSYFVFALGKFPWMKIDRPGAAIIGAVLMVAFRIVGADEALQSVDFATIVLLFAMMVVVANLRLGGFFERLAESIVQRLHPHHLLPTVILLCGVLSAFLVNDIVCLVMTPFVLHMARRLGLPPVPYLVAVATSSNIGSVATITGNPQNMLIGSLSGISYLDFTARLGPVAAAGLLLNWALIYWLCLRGKGDRAEVAEVLTDAEFRHAADAKEAGRGPGDGAGGIPGRSAAGHDGRDRRRPAADHANRGAQEGVSGDRLGPADLLRGIVRHRRRRPSRRADDDAARAGRSLGPSSHRRSSYRSQPSSRTWSATFPR